MDERFCALTGRRKVSGSNPGRPSRSKFSVVFSEIRVKMDKDLFEKPPPQGIPPVGPGPISGHLALILQLPNKQTISQETYEHFVDTYVCINTYIYTSTNLTFMYCMM